MNFIIIGMAVLGFIMIIYAEVRRIKEFEEACKKVDTDEK